MAVGRGLGGSTCRGGARSINHRKPSEAPEEPEGAQHAEPSAEVEESLWASSLRKAPKERRERVLVPLEHEARLHALGGNRKHSA